MQRALPDKIICGEDAKVEFFFFFFGGKRVPLQGSVYDKGMPLKTHMSFPVSGALIERV